MASEHELKIKAVLDTTDIDNKLNELKNSRSSSISNQGMSLQNPVGMTGGIIGAGLNAQLAGAGIKFSNFLRNLTNSFNVSIQAIKDWQKSLREWEKSSDKVTKANEDIARDLETKGRLILAKLENELKVNVKGPMDEDLSYNIKELRQARSGQLQNIKRSLETWRKRNGKIEVSGDSLNFASEMEILGAKKSFKKSHKALKDLDSKIKLLENNIKKAVDKELETLEDIAGAKQIDNIVGLGPKPSINETLKNANVTPPTVQPPKQPPEDKPPEDNNFNLNNALLKRAIGLIVAQIPSSIAEMYSASGDVKAAKTLEMFSNIGMQTAMGGAIGGAAGAGIGFASGLLTEAFKSLTDEINKTLSSVKEFQQSINSAKDIDKANSNYLYSLKMSSLIDTNDISKIQAEADSILKKIDAKTKAIADIGTGEGALTKYQMRLNQLKQEEQTIVTEKRLPGIMGSPGRIIDDEEALARKTRIQEQIQIMEANIEGYQKNTAEINSLNDVLDQYKNAIKAEKERRKSIAEGIDNQLNSIKASDISKLTSQEIVATNTDLDMTTLDRYDYFKNRLNESRSALQQHLNKAIELFNKAKDLNLTSKEQQDLIKQAQKEQLLANSSQGIVGQFQSALASVRFYNPMAPDMSNVTSLAGMGLGMGEKGDQGRLDMQREYQNQVKENLDQQKELQKELLDVQKTAADYLQAIKDLNSTYN